MSVVIVTDATASIGPALAQEMGVAIVPVPIHFGSSTFMDGVDSPAEFYRLLSGDVLPTSAAPAPGVFADTYRRLAAEYDEIVSVHVMASKSVTYQSACLGAQMLPEHKIHVVDSGQVTFGLGLMALGAARMARAGRTGAEIVSWLQRATPCTHVFAAIRELTMLRRSGRVGLGKALVAGFLDIKPVLHLRESKTDVCAQVRSWPRAVERVVDLAVEKVGSKLEGIELAVVHTNALDEAKALLARMQSTFPGLSLRITDAGPALATHAGPGAVGIALIRDPEAGE